MNKIKEYLKNIGYASKIIWAASKKYFILKFLLSLVSSMLPYLPLFLWRELINALVEAIGGNAEPLVQKIWWLTMLYCAVMLMEKLLDTVSDLVSFKYNDAINYYLDNAMIDKVSAIDLAFFDSSDLNDKLDNAWDLMYSTKNMVSFVFDMLQRTIRLIISFSLVLTLSLWLVPVVIILCIPSVIGDRKVNDMNYRFEKDYTKSHRKLEYYKDLFFEGACSEVRLYHLRDYFSSLYTDIWELWDKAVHAKNIMVCLINIASLVLLTVVDIDLKKLSTIYRKIS